MDTFAETEVDEKDDKKAKTPEELKEEEEKKKAEEYEEKLSALEKIKTTDDLVEHASTELKNVMYQIPYLREVVVGGELAKLAFDYMYENAPAHVKKDMKGAFETAVKGRFQAFKNWITAAWTGTSDM